MTYRERYDELIIQHDGEEWRVINVGAKDGDRLLCHLASTTRGRHQRNGWSPAQIGDWIDIDTLEAARHDQSVPH